MDETKKKKPEEEQEKSQGSVDGEENTQSKKNKGSEQSSRHCRWGLRLNVLMTLWCLPRTLLSLTARTFRRRCRLWQKLLGHAKYETIADIYIHENLDKLSISHNQHLTSLDFQ